MKTLAEWVCEMAPLEGIMDGVQGWLSERDELRLSLWRDSVTERDDIRDGWCCALINRTGLSIESLPHATLEEAIEAACQAYERVEHIRATKARREKG